MPKEKIKIGLVDDHTLVREGIKTVLNRFDGFDVILEASNGQELLEKLNSSEQLPEILLIDISMPIMNGFEAVNYITNHYANIKCIALSVNADDYSVFTMIKNGARAYLIKDCEPRQLYDTIIEVLTKGNSFDSFVIDSLLKHKMESSQMNSYERARQDDSEVRFSKNELEFIKLNCSELSYGDIAEIMHLSQRTIEGYRDSVFKKIKVKNRHGLMLYAIRNGIYVLK